MCHFYANALSILLPDDPDIAWESLQQEHTTAVRTLGSFKEHVEAAVEARQLEYAQSLLVDDDALRRHVKEQSEKNRTYVQRLLRALYLSALIGHSTESFVERYVKALAEGINLRDEDTAAISFVERMSPDDILALIRRLTDAMRHGDAELGLAGWEAEMEDVVESLTGTLGDIEDLLEESKKNGTTLKSKYSSQSKVLRTTVVAQKVQLSRDSAALTEQDKAFTSLVGRLTELLAATIFCERAESVFLHETFVYDSTAPCRDVFIPRPGATFEHALSRAHDDAGEAAATAPATAILYRLYQEAGVLINVADLWSAYFALVGDDTETGMDERTALVEFYRGLADLKMMGFVKPSRKKADHIAKVKWI